MSKTTNKFAPEVGDLLREVTIARSLGLPVEGVSLYPILDHPCWDEDRYCPTNLLARSENVADLIAFPPLAETILEANLV
ncbi:hypothetical protein GCM10008023_21010 [Sphingomonas glacialis]|uniref:Uncharacterized protein n=1 Tax=Sphingomonas glacialis TaxID=658225 RepID=A0ABQ3LHV8_9SPHN|nr:hypothetical protein [Sphingomonas glacialis]GHH16708.1 hypothetical protein GCM10008023_21010 [Sphingomonas glacialis]